MVARRKKIAYIVNNFCYAGVENFLMTLMNRLDKEEFEFYLFILNYFDPDFLKKVDSGVHIFYLKREKPYSIKFFYQLIRHLRRRKIHLLHVNNWSTFIEGIIIKLFNPRIKVIYVQHGLEFEYRYRGNFLKNNLRKLVLQAGPFFFEKFIAVSKAGKLFLEKELAISNVQVIYNGVNLKRFNISNGEDSFKMNSNNKVFVLATIGRIVPVKNVMLMMQVVNILKNKIPNLFFYHIGENPVQEQANQVFTEIMEYVEKNELEKQVAFLGTRDDVDTILRGVDVYLNSSFSEGISLALLEAQASGIPGVVSQVGGNCEIITDGLNGYLVNANDENEFAEKIYHLFMNPKLKEKMGMNSRKKVEELFREDKMLDKYSEIYRTV